MLAVTPISSNKGPDDFSIGPDDFSDFSGSNLLDSIDFDDLIMGMHDGDILPNLEMDPELLAEFSLSGGDESSDISRNCDDTNLGLLDAYYEANNNNINDDGVFKKGTGEEIDCNKHVKVESLTSSPSKEGDQKGKKLSSSSSSNLKYNNNNNQAKRKTKVDWTPELHRRFVQAVEQLGVDKAVPSRILELMGIDCLTRHNIASHLQKYRSHRKHLLAREAEAANWSQKRQMVSPWYPPTIGFPPMTSYRPLHVWGHPTMDPQTRMPMWPKQLLTSTVPWAPPPPPVDPSFWHHRRVGVAAAPVPGIPPHTMFRPDQHGLPPKRPHQSTGSHPSLDLHPSKESIDAAIGDVLAKPWQALPIGLKPPSMDSVMMELQRQGIPKIPPSCA